MDKKLYTWDELYERADGKGFGDPELKAKDEARYELAEEIKRKCSYDIEECEIPEEEIEYFLEKNKCEYLFDEAGSIVKIVEAK